MSKILIDEATVKLVLEALEQCASHNCYLEREAITALKKLAEQPAQQEPFGYFKAEPFGWTDCAETDEGAVALYTTPQPAQQGPKFWVVSHKEQKLCDFFRSKKEADDWASQFNEGWAFVEPLYTSPPTQRKPLTDEQILEILCIYLDEDDDIEEWRHEINEARAIEAAHGIKENT